MMPVDRIRLHRQRGMTIVEVMIAATISLILLAGVLQIFISNKRTYQINEAMSRVQENARFVTHILTSDIRMAGFIGCMSSNNPNNFESIVDSANYEFDLNNLLVGYEYTEAGWSPALDASFADDVLPGTDVIAIKHLAGDGVSLTDPFSNSAQLFINPDMNRFAIGDILLATDCEKASLFQVTNLVPQSGRMNVVHSNSGTVSPGNSTNHFTNSFAADAKIAKLSSTVFYIGTGASGEPALFRRTLNRDGTSSIFAAQELIEGVENMQILYGERTGANTRFVTADSVTNMDNVVAVRIALLLKTTGDLGNVASAPDTRTYDLVGTSVDPSDDRVLRRVVTTTITLRNRGLGL